MVKIKILFYGPQCTLVISNLGPNFRNISRFFLGFSWVCRKYVPSFSLLFTKPFLRYCQDSSKLALSYVYLKFYDVHKCAKFTRSSQDLLKTFWKSGLWSLSSKKFAEKTTKYWITVKQSVNPLTKMHNLVTVCFKL